MSNYWLIDWPKSGYSYVLAITRLYIASPYTWEKEVHLSELIFGKIWKNSQQYLFYFDFMRFINIYNMTGKITCTLVWLAESRQMQIHIHGNIDSVINQCNEQFRTCTGHDIWKFFQITFMHNFQISLVVPILYCTCIHRITYWN